MSTSTPKEKESDDKKPKEKGDNDNQKYDSAPKEDEMDDAKETVTPRILMYYSPNETADEKEQQKLNPVTLTEIANNINPTTKKPYITHIEICTLHLSKFDTNVYIHINDESPSNSDFTSVKDSVSTAQAAGIEVLFMLGGAEGI